MCMSKEKNLSFSYFATLSGQSEALRIQKPEARLRLGYYDEFFVNKQQSLLTASKYRCIIYLKEVRQKTLKGMVTINEA